MAKALRAAAVLLALLPGLARASTIERLPGNPGFVHEVFTAGDGLPAAGIAQTLQTRDGFLWVATFNGLARFDGARFEVFDSERVPALGSNRIYNLAEAPDGALWLRTEQGHLVRYADGVFTACAVPKGGRADCSLRQAGAPGYTLLQEDRSGALWAGGPDGVFRVEGGGLREAPELKIPALVKSVFLDRTGGFWVGIPGRPLAARAPWPGTDRPAGRRVHAGLPHRRRGRLRGLGRRSRGGRPAPRHDFVPEIPGPGLVSEDPRGGIWIALPGRLIHQRAGVRRELWSEPGSSAPDQPPPQRPRGARAEPLGRSSSRPSSTTAVRCSRSPRSPATSA